MKTIIQLCHLSIGYRLKQGKEKIIKDHISQDLHRGEITCLMGQNGAGKSTLIRTIAGFQQALSGEILCGGVSVNNLSDGERAQLIGVVLTDRTDTGGITVFELVSLGRHPHTGFFGSLKPADKEIVFHAMEQVGITHKANNYISELSDGERQKAMIAKALAQECPIILLDEPTAFLDINSRIETMELLQKLAAEEQKSILLSTHDVESAVRMGDRFWLMNKDKPFIAGLPKQLIQSGTFDEYFNLSAYKHWSAMNYLNTHP